MIKMLIKTIYSCCVIYTIIRIHDDFNKYFCYMIFLMLVLLFEEL